MQFVKLVVELSDHLLNVGRFFLSIELLEDGNLDIVLLQHALLHHRQEGLLGQHVFDLGVFVPAEELHVRLVDLVDELRVDLHVWHGWDLIVLPQSNSHATRESRWLSCVHACWSQHGRVAGVLGDLLLRHLLILRQWDALRNTCALNRLNPRLLHLLLLLHHRCRSLLLLLLWLRQLEAAADNLHLNVAVTFGANSIGASLRTSRTSLPESLATRRPVSSLHLLNGVDALSLARNGQRDLRLLLLLLLLVLLLLLCVQHLLLLSLLLLKHHRGDRV